MRRLSGDVSHHLQLLKLPGDIKVKIANNSLNVSQAIEIAEIPPDKQSKIVSQVVNENLTVRQIRELKTVLKEEEEEEEDPDEVIVSLRDPSKSSSAIAKKTSLTLKIALTRIDSLINEVHNTVEPDQRAEIINFLMSIRLHIHSLIDESIRFKNNQKPRH
jgi:ParB family chromosome partitioning protein